MRRNQVDRQLFSERLREYIVESGLTQTEVAKRAGISPSTLRSYLSGKTLPKIDKLMRLHGVLGIRTDYLAGMSDEK